VLAKGLGGGGPRPEAKTRKIHLRGGGSRLGNEGYPQ